MSGLQRVTSDVLARIIALAVDDSPYVARNISLAALARVSRQFYAASVDVLYGDLRMDWLARAGRLLARTLAESPRLAVRVRQFIARGVFYQDWAASHAELILASTTAAVAIAAEARARQQTGERGYCHGWLEDLASPELDALDDETRHLAFTVLEESCYAAWLDQGHQNWPTGPPTGHEAAIFLFYTLELLTNLRVLTLSGTGIWAHRMSVPGHTAERLKRLVEFHTQPFDDSFLALCPLFGRVRRLTFTLRETLVQVAQLPPICLPALTELKIVSRVHAFPFDAARLLSRVAPPSLRKLTITETHREFLMYWAQILTHLPELDHLHLDANTGASFRGDSFEFLDWLASARVRTLHLGLEPTPALMLAIPTSVVSLAVRPDSFAGALYLLGHRDRPLAPWLHSRPQLCAFEITCSRHNLSLAERAALVADLAPTFADAGVRLVTAEVWDDWSAAWTCVEGCSSGCAPQGSYNFDSDCESSDGSGSE